MTHLTDPIYAEPEELKDFIGKTTDTDDVKLATLLLSAEEVINRYTNRPDGFLADASGTARVYAGSGNRVQDIDECISISAVAVKSTANADSYTAWASTDYIKFSGDPEKPDFNGLPYTHLMIDPTGDYSVWTSGLYTHRAGFRPASGTFSAVPTVQVTARWGYAETVPYAIKQATLALASRWHKRFEGGWSDALASVELGQMMYMKEIDPDIKTLLKRFVIPTI